MKEAILKPSKKDVLVPNIATGKPLAAQGEKLVIDRYWSRRLKDGDVTIAKSKS